MTATPDSAGAQSSTQSSTTPGTYSAVTPARILDTRTGIGISPAAVRTNETVAFRATGVAGVPATGVGSVVLNVTAIAPARSGYVTVYQHGTTLPPTSSVNFSAGQNVANLVVASLGPDGMVSIFNGSAGVLHLAVDVSGYYTAGVPTVAGASGWIAPVRALDTRSGGAAPVAPGASVTVAVNGVAGIPASSVSAAVVNVTAVLPSAAGFVSVYADGTRPPTSSNVNFTAGQIVANLAVAPVGANGRVALLNGSSGTVHLIVDVLGYVLAGPPVLAGTVGTFQPVRLLDTRSGLGDSALLHTSTAPLSPGQEMKLRVTGRDHVPTDPVAAVIANVTATQPTQYGYLSVHASGTAPTPTSSVNFVADQTVANLVIAPVGADGMISIANGSQGSVHVVVDVAGYVLAAPPVDPAVVPIEVGWPDGSHGEQGSSVEHVACPAVGACVAVGSYMASRANPGFSTSSAIFRQNGAGWSTQATPLPQDSADAALLQALTCPTVGLCVAVGRHYNESVGDFVGLIETLRDGTWTAISAPSPTAQKSSQLYSVTCPEATTCFAVGQYVDDGGQHSLLEKYDGDTWSSVAVDEPAGLVTGDLGSISCPSATQCVAVGSGRNTPSGWSHPYALAFDGTAWTSTFIPEPPGAKGGYPSSIACPTATWCAVIGTYSPPHAWLAPFTATLSDGVWTSAAAPIPADAGTGLPGTDVNSLYSLSCSAVRSCAGVGYYYAMVGSHPITAGLIETMSGGDWQASRAPVPHTPIGGAGGHLRSVSCVANSKCAAVGDFPGSSLGHSGGLIETLDGGVWSAHEAPMPADVPTYPQPNLLSVSLSDEGSFVAVGNYVDYRNHDEGLIESMP